MKIQFEAQTSEAGRELSNIVKVEAKNHFASDEYTLRVIFNTVVVKVYEPAYLEDLKQAREHLDEVGYMKDFVSEVKENLSFVPVVYIDNKLREARYENSGITRYTSDGALQETS